MPIFAAAYAGYWAAAAFALAAAGTTAQVVGQRKARQQQQRQFRESQAAQARAEALQNRRADITAARQRRRAAAEARRFRATGVNLAANRGAGGALGAPGSTVPGISGSIQSQLNFNNAFINQVTTLNQGIRSAFSEASAIRSRPITAGANWTAFGQVAGTIGSAIFQHRKTLAGAFGGSGGTPPPASNAEFLYQPR